MSDPALITQLRENLAALLSDVEHVSICHPYPVEEVSSWGEAWLGFDFEDVTMGGREIGLHSIDLYYVVNRDGSLDKEVAATEPAIATIKTKIRGNQNLGLPDNCDSVRFRSVRQSMITASGDREYVGFVMSLEIKVHENLSSEYGVGPS